MKAVRRSRTSFYSMSVLNFLLKNLQGCCLLFNYQGSFSLLSSQRQPVYIITFTIACQQLFIFLFCCLFRSSLSFETAYLEYHFLRHLSTRNLFFFHSFFNLLEVTFQAISFSKIVFFCLTHELLSTFQSRLTRQLI